MEKNLCLYCGAGGHSAKDCCKASSAWCRWTAKGFGAVWLKKIAGNSQSAHARSCINSSCAIPMVHLNAAAFYDPDSLLISLKLPTISDSVSAPSYRLGLFPLFYQLIFCILLLCVCLHKVYLLFNSVYWMGLTTLSSHKKWKCQLSSPLVKHSL